MDDGMIWGGGGDLARWNWVTMISGRKVAERAKSRLQLH